MNNIIQWLRKIEHLANEIYLLAAATYADDPQFYKFLKHMAEDEARHFHVMGRAAEFLSSQSNSIPAIFVDSDTSDRIINYFNHMKNGLANQTLSRDALLEKIIQAELSEWNDIFLYVVNFLKAQNGDFKYPVARMQAHLKGIAYYLEHIEKKPEIFHKIRKLPPVWVERILIVDDKPMIADLIKALLNREGDIDVAHNGSEAFKLIEGHFYKLVVSDVDMPVMDGFTLYQKAVAKFPKLSSRFLFMTGDVSPERKAFFDEHRVPYMEKPMNIKALREMASKMILAA